MAIATVWHTLHHDGKIRPAWCGWGCMPTLSTITYKVVVYSPAERAGTPPSPISTLPLYMYFGSPVGIFKKAMGARHQIGIGLSYRPARPEPVLLNVYGAPELIPRNEHSASTCSLAGRYDNPIPPRFLAPIDFLKIPAQISWRNSFLGIDSWAP